jgi:uncharacterized membrane protein YgdD (TMEM256/DUF423 family)
MNTISRNSMAAGAIFMVIAVAFGALGSHMLKQKLDATYLLTWETAVRYQAYHALALIIVGLIHSTRPVSKYISYLFVAGIILFSGSLYGLSLGSTQEPNMFRFLGPVTPLGGVCFIIGWVMLAWNILKR